MFIPAQGGQLVALVVGVVVGVLVVVVVGVLVVGVGVVALWSIISTK